MADFAHCSHLIQGYWDQLVHWLEPCPAPLLHWLHGSAFITRSEYFSLLEVRPKKNQVISILERVCHEPAASQIFLEKLKELQEIYNPELQHWLQETVFMRSKTELFIISPDHPLKTSRGKSLMFWQTRKYKLPRISADMQKNNSSTFRKGLDRQLKAALQNHRRLLLTQTEKLRTNMEDTEPCKSPEVYYPDLLLLNRLPYSNPTSHDYLQLASHQTWFRSYHASSHLDLCHLFSPFPQESSLPHRVLLSGPAGIGKTVLVQKILHYWALGRAFQGFLGVLNFSFQELSLITATQSLEDLIRRKFAHLNGVLSALLERPRELLLILDGLDEFRHLLDSKHPCLWPDESGHMKDVVCGLLYGTLLPEATILVTSRSSVPLPPELFNRHVLILGLQEAQVKDYVSQFFQSSRHGMEVMNYLSTQHGLANFTFLPLYCFVLCSALDQCFSDEGAPSPSTITELYLLYVCTILKLHQVPSGQEEAVKWDLRREKDLLLQLGQLAYVGLLRGQTVFYADDLQEFGFDPWNLPFYLNQIFFKETNDIYIFSHLTVQEFLAALYSVVNLDFNAGELTYCLDLWWNGKTPEDRDTGSFLNPTERSASGFYNYTWQSLNRHPQWDKLQMFSRFFMGLLTSRLEGKLEGLLGSNWEGDPVLLLADWFGKKASCESGLKLLSLIHCLAELHQDDVTQKVICKMGEVDLFTVTLNRADCAALAYVLSCSKSQVLQNLNLSYSNMGTGGLKQLQDHLHRCKTLQLQYNSLDWEAAEIEAMVLRSPQCCLEKLVLCGNRLSSRGANLLWNVLRDNTTLEELHLDLTNLTDRGLDNILDCLSGNTTLRLLSITGNRFSQAGHHILSELHRRKPKLKIVSSFLSDTALLQNYLDWVDKLTIEQMESVSNAGALDTILETLMDTDDPEASQEAQEKAGELKKKIFAIRNDDKTEENSNKSYLI
ncbi:NLR family CARD domain-containing protein 3-like [Ahaetulla prasina]|uniref:NLR family CARD domain-containing protein 3-like n=1 Tax=Ahaetulla prasina TaxID=499056 RepID=UPI002649C541|nr:NLR family CARD domain-containing protein 3-like [Ahaetulla prasina]